MYLRYVLSVQTSSPHSVDIGSNTCQQVFLATRVACSETHTLGSTAAVDQTRRFMHPCCEATVYLCIVCDPGDYGTSSDAQEKTFKNETLLHQARVRSSSQIVEFFSTVIVYDMAPRDMICQNPMPRVTRFAHSRPHRNLYLLP